jgi:hypothetical protein
MTEFSEVRPAFGGHIVCPIRKIVKPAEATFPGKNGKIAYERNGGGKTEVTQGGAFLLARRQEDSLFELGRSLALAMGLMLSIGLIFLLKHPDDRRNWPEEVERQKVLPGIYVAKPASLS